MNNSQINDYVQGRDDLGSMIALDDCDTVSLFSTKDWNEFDGRQTFVVPLGKDNYDDNMNRLRISYQRRNLLRLVCARGKQSSELPDNQYI